MNFGERIQQQLDQARDGEPITVISLAVYPHTDDSVEVVVLANGVDIGKKGMVRIIEVARHQMIDQILREQFESSTESPWPDITREDDGRQA